MRRFILLLGLAALGLTLALVGGAGTSVQTAKGFDPTQMNEIQERILSEFASSELFPSTTSETGAQQPSQYFPRGSDTCPTNLSSNIRVNQACLNLTDSDLQGRGQAQNETSIAIDPMNTNHLIATSNDYRRGDGNCFSEYSLDKGRTWNDTSIPMAFTRGVPPSNVRYGDFGAARQYWEAGGDPSVAFDTKGNAYMSCQVFNRGKPPTSSTDVSSALLVFRSTQNAGASWDFPGRYVRASAGVTDAQAVANPFLDKQLMTVDNHVGSPFQDRIYVSWTEFAADGSAFIYEAFSADYGEHFSGAHLVSANTPLCTNTYGAGVLAVTGETSNCNENQFSQPFTGPDGALYVLFNNYNNPETKTGNDNRNQILLAKSVDGGNTFSTPIKVSDYYDLPDCATY